MSDSQELTRMQAPRTSTINQDHPRPKNPKFLQGQTHKTTPDLFKQPQVSSCITVQQRDWCGLRLDEDTSHQCVTAPKIPLLNAASQGTVVVHSLEIGLNQKISQKKQLKISNSTKNQVKTGKSVPANVSLQTLDQMLSILF